MSSVIVDVAGAVMGELEEGTFAMPFTLARAYTPIYDLKEMDGVRVTVVPRESAITNLDRGRVSNAVAVDVAVQRKVASVEPAVIDPLMGLVQELGDFLTRRKLAAAPDARWTRIENGVIYAPEHMNEKRMFTSVLTVTYLVSR